MIVHAAGTASVGASFDKPLQDLQASVLTWASVLECVRRTALSPKIVFPSSAAVYGNPAYVPITEDHAVMASLISRAELHVIDRGGNPPMHKDTAVAGRIFSQLSYRGRCLSCKLHRR